MAKIAYQQMMGLDRIAQDSAIIQKYSIVRSSTTELDFLCLALHYALKFGYTMADLSSKYGLRKATLCDIKAGRSITHNRSVYAFHLVKALNDCRLRAINRGKEDEAIRIGVVLGELMLVQVGIATDSELAQPKLDEEVRRERERLMAAPYYYDAERLRKTLLKA